MPYVHEECSENKKVAVSQTYNTTITKEDGLRSKTLLAENSNLLSIQLDSISIYYQLSSMLLVNSYYNASYAYF